MPFERVPGPVGKLRWIPSPPSPTLQTCNRNRSPCRSLQYARNSLFGATRSLPASWIRTQAVTESLCTSIPRHRRQTTSLSPPLPPGERRERVNGLSFPGSPPRRRRLHCVVPQNLAGQLQARLQAANGLRPTSPGEHPLHPPTLGRFHPAIAAERRAAMGRSQADALYLRPLVNNLPPQSAQFRAIAC